MNIIFFENQYKFREWIENNHDKVSELIVGIYKVDVASHQCRGLSR